MLWKNLVLFGLLALAAAEDYIDTLDDNFDFSTLTSSQVRDVALCFMDQGPCDDLLNSYKKHYPEVMINACRRCSSSQKQITVAFYSRLADELPDVYAAIKRFLDPEDKYFDKFQAAIRN